MRQGRLDPSRTDRSVRGPAANHLDDYGGTAVLTGCSDSRVQGEKVKNTQPLMVSRCLVWVASCLAPSEGVGASAGGADERRSRRTSWNDDGSGTRGKTPGKLKLLIQWVKPR